MSELREPAPRTRSVLDPVHGLIRLTDREMQLIDHPLFQRLRMIRQNGLLHLVFPAATHTRFEHSLGVMFVAHGMLNSLTLNSRVGVSKGNVHSLAKANAGQAVEFAGYRTPEWIFVYEVTRLAALAHDLGHGPLSHTFDSFSPSRAMLATLLKDESMSAIESMRSFMLDWGKDTTKADSHTKNRRTPHELMSCVFFTRIWHEIGGDPQIATAVCAAILGESGGVNAASFLTDATARP